MKAAGWLQTVVAAALWCAGPNVLAQENAAAPAWTLEDPGGHPVRLADFHGRVVLLNFWATWCPPCRKEIPGLVALQGRYGAKGLAVVGVSISGEAAAVGTFAKSLGINYPVVLGTPLVMASYGCVEVVPTTFVIDRAGRISAIHEGVVDTETLAAEIKPLL